MNTEQALMERSGSTCELCSAQESLVVVEVSGSSVEDSVAENSVMICSTCSDQLANSDKLNVNHWRCLNDSMWSQVPVVQVMVWRQLSQLSLSGEHWAQDLLDMLYLEEGLLEWAKSDLAEPQDDSDPTLDSNGAVLNAGDTVTIIKDLDVKGAGFTAKRGTAVRNIGLTSNPEQIEGRVNGTRIVLLTKFLKKSG